MQPRTPFHQHEAYNALYEIRKLGYEVNRNYRQVRKPTETEHYWYGKRPHESAVKEECDNGFTSGPQCKVSRIYEAVNRHAQAYYAYE